MYTKQNSYLPAISTNGSKLSSQTAQQNWRLANDQSCNNSETVKHGQGKVNRNKADQQLKHSVSLPTVVPSSAVVSSLPEHGRRDKLCEKGNLVIIQLWTDEGNRNDQISSDEQIKKCSVSTAPPSPIQQHKFDCTKAVTKATTQQKNHLTPQQAASVTTGLSSVRRQKTEDNSVKNGFTQADLKCHTERERHRTRYVFNEQDQSKKIVKEWLNALHQ
eukprot:gene16839-18538_t